MHFHKITVFSSKMHEKNGSIFAALWWLRKVGWESGREAHKGGDICMLHEYVLSHVWLFVTPWTVACQALLSVKFSNQEYWNGLSFPPPGDPKNDHFILYVFWFLGRLPSQLYIMWLSFFFIVYKYNVWYFLLKMNLYYIL